MTVPLLKYASGNSASTTASSSISDSDTSLPLTSDTNFDGKSGAGMVVIDEGEATEEFAYATGKSGASLTIPLANRGLEGSAAAGHSAGATVKGIFSAKMWNDLIDSIKNVLDQDTGAVDTTKVVTLTGTQTLTNKTFTSPKVGTAITDTNGNEIIKTPATSSAVNEITVTNAATGANPKIEATGDDTNIGLNLATKGTGKLQFGGVSLTNILQVSVSASLGETTATNQDTATHCGQLAFTPRSAASTIYVFAVASGIDNGGSGRMQLSLVYNTSTGGTTGTEITRGVVANDSTTTNGVLSLSMLGSFAPASTAAQYIKLINTKQDSNTTWYVGRYLAESKIIAIEVLA